MNRRTTRRWFLGASATVGAGAVTGLLGCGTAAKGAGNTSGGDFVPGQGDAGPMGDGAGRCEPTGEDILGPFYREDAPNRAKIAADDEPGTRLRVRGRVTAADCTTPLEGAVVDVWQADDSGNYDNDSQAFRLRGRMFTDAEGRYELETIVPGYYSGRPRHIHYRVIYESGPVDRTELVTQLYFAGDPEIPSDPWADPARAIEVTDTGSELEGTFDIVLVV